MPARRTTRDEYARYFARDPGTPDRATIAWAALDPGDDEARDPPAPTPGEIAVATAEIRATWSEWRWEVQRRPMMFEVRMTYGVGGVTRRKGSWTAD